MKKIHIEVSGQGKALLLIHGWAMHTGVWRNFAQNLAKRYQVICVDLPGHGLSEKVTSYTLENISAALFEAIPVSDFSILGWSLGASVAISMARQKPECVNSLVLVGANPKFVQDQDWAGMNATVFEAFAENLTADFKQTLIRFLALQVNGLENGKEVLNELKQALQACKLPEPEILQAGLQILKMADLRQDFSALNCPVCLIQGDTDNLIPKQVGNAMQKLLPTTKLNIIPGAGHVPFLSHPQQMLDIIVRFL